MGLPIAPYTVLQSRSSAYFCAKCLPHRLRLHWQLYHLQSDIDRALCAYIKKDAVRLVGFVISASPDDIRNWPEEMQNSYFQQALSFLTQKYGAENLMFAVVHRDQATPHMHVGLVPFTKDGRLCAKELFAKYQLITLQTEFAQIGAPYGLSRGERGRARKHLSIPEYKIYAEARKRGLVAPF